MSIDDLQARLSRFPRRSGTGLCLTPGGAYRVRAARTLFGVETDVLDADAEHPRALSTGERARAIYARMRGAVPPSAGSPSEPKDSPEAAGTSDYTGSPFEDEPIELEVEDREYRAAPVTIGLRASAVTFLSEVQPENPPVQSSSSDREDSRSESEDKRSQSVLTDKLTVPVGKQQIQLTAKVRFTELESIQAETGLSADELHRYEPEPWAAWRASNHYAPFDPARGIHLRFLLGENEGLAILGTPRWPLAWQVLSYDDECKAEAILQAYHLLNVHVRRRLKLDGITDVTVQGNDGLEEAWAEVEQGMGMEIFGVDGPVYDENFTAFGLALGSLDPRGETLNLARSIQQKPSLLAMAPWGEAGFILSVCVCMFLVLQDHAAGLRAQLGQVQRQTGSVTWANGRSAQQLEQELDLLRREVSPMIKYLKRELYFSRAMDSVATELPAATWLVSVNGGDHVWKRNPNKSLGERYLQIEAGAPSRQPGMAPPEINDAVRALESNTYMKEVLPRVKLTDVNWRQRAGSGFTVFSVLSSSKE